MPRLGPLQLQMSRIQEVGEAKLDSGPLLWGGSDCHRAMRLIAAPCWGEPPKTLRPPLLGTVGACLSGCVGGVGFAGSPAGGSLI